MGSALKQIDDELKRRSPDWENVIQPNVQILQERSPFLMKWFPKGSGPEAGTKTYALPAIWQKGDDFAKHARAMVAESQKLQPVFAKKDSGEMRAQVVALGKTCKGCHDGYRSPDYEKDAEQ
jgi:cytochrome c556